MKMKKRLISLLLSLAMLLALLPTTAFAASGSGTRFQDVKTTDWFYGAVEYVAQKNMMSGTAANRFSPNQTTTRGMIVTILYRMEGEPSTTGTAFSDVAKGQWYTDAVAWANTNGIVTGYGGGIFGPNDAITREQMAAILYRYAQHKGYETGASGNITSFSDGGKVSSYAVQAMNWAVGSGLISGVGNNTLSPQSGATRAQAATILMRFDQEITGAADSSNIGMVYSVSDVQATGKSATVTVNTIDSCTLELTVLDEDGTKTLFKTSTTVGKNLEIFSAAVPLPQALPKYFVMRAVLKDQSGKELCDPYTTIKYTQRYEEFLAKTVDDFEDDIVLNLDSSKSNNFAVLNENAVRVDCTDTSNVCVVNGNVYTFTKTNSQLDGVSSGDVVALFDQGKALTAIVVQNVSTKGDTVTITVEKDPSIQELYQYIKVDIEETAGSFQKETDPYLAYGPTGSIGGAALRQASDWRKDLKQDVAANPAVSSKLEQSTELSVGNSIKLEVKTDLTMKYALSLEYDFSWLQNTVDFEVTSEISGEVSAKLDLEKKSDSTQDTVETFLLSAKDIDAKLGKYWIPTSLPGVSFTVELSVPVKLNVNSGVELKQEISMTNGVGVRWKNGKVTYNTIADKQNERTLNWKGEGSISVGAKVAVGVNALSVVSGELSGEIGAMANAGWAMTLWTESEPESKHLCKKCLSGDVKGYAKAGVRVELGIEWLNLSTTLVDLTIAEVEFLKRDFYVSIDKFMAGDTDYTGWNTTCPNMAYLTKILTKDTTGKELDDIAVSIYPTNETQAKKQETTGGELVYLCNGSYSAMAQGGDGKVYSKGFTVAGETQEVTVELPVSDTNEVVVDLYTGMPQIRYYNDKGQVAYIIVMSSDWDPGSWDAMAEGYLHDVYAVTFTYDTQGKLTRSISTTISDTGWYSNQWLFEGELHYKYEGNLINAYDNDGKIHFSLDEHGNIVKEYIYNTYYPDNDYQVSAKYTYDTNGNVTAISKSDNDGTYQVKVAYDSDGNVISYDATEMYKDQYQAYDDLYKAIDQGTQPEVYRTEYDLGRKYYALAGDLKYFYENGRMIRFDDSGYSKWPWLFFYDSNGLVSTLQIEDLDDGTHGWHYVSTRNENDRPEFRSRYSLMTYQFSMKTDNGVPKLSIWYYLDYRADNPAYDYDVEKTITVPSK